MKTALACLFLAACATTGRVEQRCRSYRHRQRIAGAIAAGAGVAAGGAGLEAGRRESNWFAYGSAASGVLSASASYVAESYAADIERECGRRP